VLNSEPSEYPWDSFILDIKQDYGYTGQLIKTLTEGIFLRIIFMSNSGKVPLNKIRVSSFRIRIFGVLDFEIVSESYESA